MAKDDRPAWQDIARDASALDFSVAGLTAAQVTPAISKAAHDTKTCSNCSGSGVSHVAWSKDVGATVVPCGHCTSKHSGRLATILCGCVFGAMSLVMLSAMWLR